MAISSSNSPTEKEQDGPGRQSWLSSIRSGYLWVAISRVVQIGTQFVVLALLARSLNAAEIGIFSFTLAAVNILLAVNEVGVGGAVIQFPRLPRDALSTLFWLSWAIGLFQLLIFQAGAGVWGSFTDSEVAESVMRWLSLGFLLAASGLIPSALLARNLKFREIAIQDVAAELPAGLLSVAMALSGYGVWSLVGRMLVQVALRSILGFWLCGWRPRPVFRTKDLKVFVSFSLYYTLTRLLSSISANLDYLVVGKLISTTALGFYTLAFNVSRTPTRFLAAILSRVAFPSFSRIQLSLEKFREAYLMQLSVLNGLTLPFSIMLLVFADLVIPIVYGPGWEETVVLLRIMAITGTIASLIVLNGPAILATGHSKHAFYLNLARTILLLSAVLAGAHLGGVQGIAWAVACYSIVSFLVGQAVVNALIGTSMRQVLSAVQPGLRGGMVMAALMIAIRSSLSFMDMGGIVAVVCAVFGAAAYLLIFLRSPAFKRLGLFSPMAPKTTQHSSIKAG